MTAQDSQKLPYGIHRASPRWGKSAIVHVNRGFTLIEMAMVLFIVMLGFAAIGSSVGSGNQTAAHQSAARDLTSALRFARGHALMMREQTTVDISLADNSYTVSGREKVYTIPEDIAVTVVTAQEELSGKDAAKIRFFPDGSSTGGRVKLEQNGVNWQIDINWLTGQINLAEQ